MASCPNLSCTFLDQFQTYSIQHNNHDQFWPNGSVFSPPPPPLPPTVVVDSDIAGLGVIALILLHL